MNFSIFEDDSQLGGIPAFSFDDFDTGQGDVQVYYPPVYSPPALLPPAYFNPPNIKPDDLDIVRDKDAHDVVDVVGDGDGVYYVFDDAGGDGTGTGTGTGTGNGTGTGTGTGIGTGTDTGTGNGTATSTGSGTAAGSSTGNGSGTPANTPAAVTIDTDVLLIGAAIVAAILILK